MNRVESLVCVVACLFAGIGEPLNAQVPAAHSSGLFVGLGIEGDGVMTLSSGTAEGGGGGGMELGYGFTPMWSAFGGVSGANINAEGGGSYSLTHIDGGARLHFRSDPSAFVPFIEVGLSHRNERALVGSTTGTRTLTANGTGVLLGLGLNAHISRALAFSTSVSWVEGNFTKFKFDNQNLDGASVNATSGRIRLGILWFPGA